MQKEFVFRESILELKNVLQQLQPKKVFILSSKTVFNSFKNIILPLITSDYDLLTDILSNPQYEQIQGVVKLYPINSYDIIIAIGGGSVIDFAKAYRFYSNKKIPLIAIPTTAGTGSEATQFAVVYVDGKKTSLDNIEIMPDYAIVDSQFCENSPKYLKACSAMDAYCQAIESFWAKKTTDESKKYAIDAIKLCKQWLALSVKSSDIIANENMSFAANLSGKAINISRTTASHALSYKITSDYNIPHGHAVALTIPKLFIKNLDCFNGQDILLDAIGIKSNDILPYFHNLMSDIGLIYNLSDLKIIDIDSIVDSVNIDRLENNPRKLDRDDLIELFD